MVDDQESSSLRYTLVLSIEHPTMDPAIISSKLGLEPRRSWAAGDQRTTPRGLRLARTNKTSLWRNWIEIEGRRHFSKDVSEVLLHLQEKADFIRELTDSGGSIMLYLQLPGDVNIGDELKWADLRQLAMLKIDLGIEVFPKFEINAG